jgi:hypothetical protein
MGPRIDGKLLQELVAANTGKNAIAFTHKPVLGDDPIMRPKILILSCCAALMLFAGSETSSAATVICGPSGCPVVLGPTYPGTPLFPRPPVPPPFGPGRVDIIELGTESQNEVGCIQPTSGTTCLSSLGVPVVEGDVVLVEGGAFGSPSDFLNNPHNWSDVIRFTNQMVEGFAAPVGTVELLSDIGNEPEFNTVPLSPSDLASNVVFLEELSDPTLYGATFLDLFQGVTFGTNYFIHSGVEGVPAIPEPSTITILGIGVIGLMAYGWRVGKRSAPTCESKP